MPQAPLNVVTGAFGYSGKYIAARLLDGGERVKTLTNRPGSDGGRHIESAPLDFANPRQLTQSLEGATTLYNTYWVRFPLGGATHQQAVANTKTLIRAAEQAGVRRIVHISVTKPSLDSPLSYFRGKAELEEAVRQSKLSYAILRPAVIFGDEDILINNIAWLLRKFPLFAIPGRGDYRLQPIFVEDLAALAVDSGHRSENLVLDAVGPETFAYDDLVRLIARTIGSQARIVHLSPALVVGLSRLLGYIVNDVLLTREEIEGLMADLLISSQPPNASTRCSAWLGDHAGTIGIRYASELKRHYRGKAG